MATDATGTPTSLGIPKFNVAVDAPSGLGGNAQMDSIDALLVQAPRSGSITGIAVGSVPVWNGSAWVKPSGTPDGTKFLRDDGTWAAAGASGPGYGTSLPGSPTDGQEYILVDSTSAPTYSWRFRYNSTLTKWEFVGGRPAHVRVDTAEARANTVYGALTTAGPSFTVPVAGDYDVTIGVLIGQNSGGTQASGAMSYDVGGTGASDNWATIGVYLVASLPKLAAISRTYRHTGLAISTALVSKYRSPNAGDDVLYSHRTMLVTPVKVG